MVVLIVLGIFHCICTLSLPLSPYLPYGTLLYGLLAFWLLGGVGKWRTLIGDGWGQDVYSPGSFLNLSLWGFLRVALSKASRGSPLNPTSSCSVLVTTSSLAPSGLGIMENPVLEFPLPSLHLFKQALWFQIHSFPAPILPSLAFLSLFLSRTSPALFQHSPSHFLTWKVICTVALKRISGLV